MNRLELVAGPFLEARAPSTAPPGADPASVRTLFHNLQGKGSEAGDKLSPALVAGPFLEARAPSTAQTPPP